MNAPSKSFHRLFGTSPFLRRAVEAILFVISFFVIQGYEFGDGNQHVFLPVILSKLKAPQLAGDFGVTTHLFYHANFNALLTLMAHVIPLPLAAILLHIFSLLALYAGLASVSECLGYKKTELYLALGFLFLWAGSGMDGNVLWANRLEAQYMAWPFALLAAASLTKGRPVPAGLWAGMTLLFHLQIGIFTGSLLFLFLFLDSRESFLKRLAGPGLFVLFCIPVFVQHFSTIFREGLAHDASFIDYATIRIPHHMNFDLRIFWVFIFLTALQGMALRHAADPQVVQARRRGLAISFFFLGLGLLQYLDYHILKAGPVARLQPLRMSPLTGLLGILALSSFLMSFSAQRHRSVGPMAAILASFILGPRLMGYVSLREHPEYLAAAAAALILWLTSHRFKAPRAASPFFLWLPLISLLLMKRGPLQYDTRRELQNPWVETGAWIKTHTPREALFITPPYFSGFAFYAERKTVVEFKSGVHHAKALEGWRSRLQDLSNGNFPAGCEKFSCRRSLEEGFKSLETPRIRELGRKYGATFWVTEAGGKDPGLVRIFSNSHYEVFSLSETGTA